jgi:hypothetical protein
METNGASAHDINGHISRALACFDQAYSNGLKGRPKFKPLVLSVLPNAAVRRIGAPGRAPKDAVYVCFVGDEQLHCGGVHKEPGKAWVCLARYIASGATK